MPAGPAQPSSIFTSFDDVKAQRRLLYDSVLDASRNVKPLSNGINTLRLEDVDWADSEDDPPAKVTEVKTKGRTLERRLRGTWRLYDDATGQMLSEKQQTIGAVPKLTDFGTFIHNGNSYVLRNQQRLRAGLYSRRKKNGELETHANFLPGEGLTHRYGLDPERGIFFANFRQSHIPMYSMLRVMGAKDEDMKEAWGEQLWQANKARHRYEDDVKRLAAQVLKPNERKGDFPVIENNLRERLLSMKLDPETTARTLRESHTSLSPRAALLATKRLLAIARDEDEPDSRDGMPFQQMVYPDKMFAERIARDYAGKQREILFKATNRRNLDFLPSAVLRDQIYSALLSSGLGQNLEETNLLETLDRRYSVTRLGEGGIPGLDQIPDEAREVQGSHLSFLDEWRTPESLRVGVDLFFSSAARRGPEGKLYAPYRDVRSGQTVMKTPEEIADSVVSWPNAFRHEKWPRLPVLKKGKEGWARREEIDYVIPSMEMVFSPLGNLVPLKSASKGQRIAMGSRMLTQALPLRQAEAPLVRTGVPFTDEKESYQTQFGKHLGAVFSEEDGVVVNATKDQVTIRTANGLKKVPLYSRFAFNRKTGLVQTPIVQPGQRVKAGQPLAKSNFTDDTGTLAIGKNLNVGYMPYGGLDFEDASVVSESAAKKLASVQTYQMEVEPGRNVRRGTGTFVGLYPNKFTRDQLKALDPDGVARVGTRVSQGDPLVLAVRDADVTYAKVHKRKQAPSQDASVVWEHEEPGVVVDVVQGRGGPSVIVETETPVQVGDKLSGLYGDKGVVSAVIPDEEMPRDEDGNPLDMLVSDDGTISRANSTQNLEAMLGRIALKTGQPVVIEDFRNDRPKLYKYVKELARKHGIKDKMTVYDPTTNRKNQMFGGPRYIIKLSHQAEDKLQSRGGGGYSAEGAPTGGPGNKPKRVAMLDATALLAHGAVATLRDVGANRGQRNERYWLQYMQGYDPPKPTEPLVYRKFLSQLKGAGINVVRDGTRMQLMAMTDKDIDRMTEGRRLKSAEGVDWNQNLRPIPGGMFDPQLTGGHNGNLWSAIDLAEPMPNPVFEEPIRRLLGLTKNKFQDVLAGRDKLPGGGTGAQAMLAQLRKIDVPAEIADLERAIKEAPVSRKDALIKKRQFLEGAAVTGVHPSEWFLTKAPVLPPLFRPVSRMENDVPLVADANFLYKELYDADRLLRKMKTQLGDDGVGDERLNVYNAFKAVTGLGDPLNEKLRNKRVKGILQNVFGSSPKYGVVQRKLLSTTVDNVGRSVITPDPTLDMDTIGVPEEAAFDIYDRHLARRMVKSGMQLTDALRHIKERTPQARQALLKEMESRYVYASRAPVLHMHGHLAFKPRLVKGHTLRLSPLVTKGFNADFDGDQMNFSVPGDEESAKEAREKLLPSKRLLSVADYKTPVHAPGQQYVGGLFKATAPPKPGKEPRRFASLEAAEAAFEEGTLDINDPIIIVRG